MNKTWIPYSFLILLSMLLLCGCESRKTIVHELTEAEANSILVFLAGRGIEAIKVKAEAAGAGVAAETLWNISVSATQSNEAMAILSASGLPKRRGHTLLSIFSQGSALVPSELEETIRYQAGLGEQIANTIRKIDGVLDADVQLSFPKQDPLNPLAPKGDVTAAVYVKHTGVLDDPNTQLIPKIRRLVTSSIQDLKYDNVTVIPDRARFADIPYRQILRSIDDEKDYVSIWSVIIAKESASRFRILFFSFLILIVLLILTLIWFAWKFYPIITRIGGVQALFTPHPLSPEQIEVSEEETPKEIEKSEEVEEEEMGPDLAGAEGAKEEKPKEPPAPKR